MHPGCKELPFACLVVSWWSSVYLEVEVFLESWFLEYAGEQFLKMSRPLVKRVTSIYLFAMLKKSIKNCVCLANTSVLISTSVRTFSHLSLKQKSLSLWEMKSSLVALWFFSIPHLFAPAPAAEVQNRVVNGEVVPQSDLNWLSLSTVFFKRFLIILHL